MASCARARAGSRTSSRRDACAGHLGRVVQRAAQQAVRRSGCRAPPRRRVRAEWKRIGSMFQIRSPHRDPLLPGDFCIPPSPRRASRQLAGVRWRWSAAARSLDDDNDDAGLERPAGRADASRRRDLADLERDLAAPASASAAPPSASSRRGRPGAGDPVALDAERAEARRERELRASAPGPARYCRTGGHAELLQRRARSRDPPGARRARRASDSVAVMACAARSGRASGLTALEPRAAAEAGALLVGPVDGEALRRLAFLGDPPQHLHRSEHVQAAIEPAAVRQNQWRERTPLRRQLTKLQPRPSRHQ